MCLGVPGKVIEVHEWVAIVDFWGVRKSVLLNIVDEPVSPGDYILNHVGFAIRRIPPESVEETLAMYEMLVNEGAADDLMTADILGEIEASSPNRVSVNPERSEGSTEPSLENTSSSRGEHS
jgi:hydrogenase expression/formation protein HypC